MSEILVKRIIPKGNELPPGPVEMARHQVLRVGLFVAIMADGWLGPPEESDNETSWIAFWSDPTNAQSNPRGIWCAAENGSCSIFVGLLGGEDGAPGAWTLWSVGGDVGHRTRRPCPELK